jgi:hypothetical protein
VSLIRIVVAAPDRTIIPTLATLHSEPLLSHFARVGCLPAAGRNAIRWRSWLGKARRGKLNRAFFKMKYWEIIANNLSKAGWSWGCV